MIIIYTIFFIFYAYDILYYHILYIYYTYIIHILYIYYTYIIHILYIYYTCMCTCILNILHINNTYYLQHSLHILCLCYTYTIQIVYIHLHMYGDTHIHIYIYIDIYGHTSIHIQLNWLKKQSMLVYLVALGRGRKHRRVRTESSRPGDDKKKQNQCWFELPWNVFQWCVVWGIHGYPS